MHRVGSVGDGYGGGCSGTAGTPPSSTMRSATSSAFLAATTAANLNEKNAQM